MMAVAALIGAVSSLTGLYVSYYLNVASGAAVVLVATCFFVTAFLFAPRQGAVWQARRGRARAALAACDYAEPGHTHAGERA
jgi:hypothetical protein